MQEYQLALQLYQNCKCFVYKMQLKSVNLKFTKLSWAPVEIPQDISIFRLEIGYIKYKWVF